MMFLSAMRMYVDSRIRWCGPARKVLVPVVGLAVLFAAHGVAAQSLRGSAASLDRKNRQARLHDFTYLQGPGQLRRFVSAGLLVPVEGNANYLLKDVSFPVARPEVRLFVERLAAQYRRACGERLVVTSLTRPVSNQPGNASDRSVHPTGMALDLRRPPTGRCGTWLQSTLLPLDRARVLEATLERLPPHFHVAVFPIVYVRHVARLTGRTASAVVAAATGPTRHTVRPGESLWSIASRYDTTPTAIQRSNGLSSSVIHPSQVLEVPVRQ